MNGLELSRGYYEEYGKPMLEREFARLLPYIAVGFTGRGSEHYGFDDEISRDHDFEPGFNLFLPGEDIVSRRDAFLLERAYAKLPSSYRNIERQKLSPVGGNRHGVCRTADFYQSAVGFADGQLSLDAWLHIPDYALAEAVNGEIFLDNYGEVSQIRQNLRRMPEDIQRKRIAGNLLIMGQAGQYNYPRCLKHGEPEAAQLACGEFVSAALKTVFLLHNRYMPYYKWSFRALREEIGATDYADALAFLLIGNNREQDIEKDKTETVERLAARISETLQENHLISASTSELERCAYMVNDTITDGNIRNLHILAAI